MSSQNHHTRWTRTAPDSEERLSGRPYSGKIDGNFWELNVDAAARRAGAAGVAKVKPDMLALLALAVSALVVGAVCMAAWVWRRGWRPGEPPRE